MRRKTKYKNKISTVKGVRYLSNLERVRHQQLLMLEKAGAISNLQWQVPFRLEVNGKLICRYIADATYYLDDEFVVEETKGRWTDVAKLKKKLFEALNTPLRLTVVTKSEVYGEKRGRRVTK